MFESTKIQNMKVSGKSNQNKKYSSKFKFWFSSCTVLLGLFVVAGCAKVDEKASDAWEWELLEAQGEPTARHEAGFVAFKDKLYLIGGRRINPTDVFDPKTQTWEQKSKPPLELHHFQPVVVGNAIYLIGAMTGGFPEEKPLERVLVYYPEEDRYEFKHDIPEERRRGGAGAAYHDGLIYIVGGITNGHLDGTRTWLDSYNPKTGEWEALADAPHARDHLQAVVANGKLYSFAGRRSSFATGEGMSLTVAHGDVYDIENKNWEPVTDKTILPTERAGNAAFVWGDEVVVGSGESVAQVEAHSELEAYNTVTQEWRTWPPLLEGRHGSGFAIIEPYVYIASGSGNRGGGPELTSIERLKLPE